jgi:hypothetical protein
MPSLRDEAHDGVLCTFSIRTSATAAGFARSSQLNSSEICGYEVCVCVWGGGG